MNKLALLALIAVASPLTAYAASDTSTVRSEADAATKVTVGKMLYLSTGNRLAPVYRVNADGNPQIVLDGKLVTIPASTLTDVSGKTTTSLTRKDLGKL